MVDDNDPETEEYLQVLRTRFPGPSTLEIADMIHHILTHTRMNQAELSKLFKLSEGMICYYARVGANATPLMREVIDLWDMSAMDAYLTLKWGEEDLRQAVDVHGITRRAYRRMFNLP